MVTPPKLPGPVSHGLPRGTDLSWVRRAACAGTAVPGEPDLWYAADTGQGSWTKEEYMAEKARVARAKAICEGCPVRDCCLALAVATNDRYGLWGGLEPQERRRKDSHVNDQGRARPA